MMFYVICLGFIFIIACTSISNNTEKLKHEVEDLKFKVEHLNREIKNLKNKFNSDNIEIPKINTLQEEKQEVPENNVVENTEHCENETPVTEKQTVEYVQDTEQYEEKEKDKDKNIYVVTHDNDKSFEKMFLGNIFNIIGAIAIIIGCGFFIKMISPILTPAIKVTMGFIAGILMIIGGRNIKSSMQRYSEVLTGTGFSVLFITVFCMSALFDTFSALTSSIIGGVILICAYIVADNNKTASMPVIALTGGYLNIIFAAEHVSTPYIFGYLIFLNILSVIFVYRNPSKSPINIINLILTLLYLATSRYDELQNISIAYPLILWGVHLISGFYEKEQDTKISNIVHWTNLSVLFAFSSIIFKFAKTDIGILLLFVSIAYAIITGISVMTESPKIKTYVHSMLTTILMATLCLLSRIPLVAALSIEAVFFGYLIKTYKYNYLVNWVMVYIIASISSLLLTEGIVYSQDLSSYKLILNERLLGFISPILASFLAYFMFNDSQDKKVYNLAQAFKFSFISLIYMYITFEVNNFISSIMQNSAMQDETFIKTMLYSIIACTYSLQMNRFAKSVKLPILEIVSLFSYVIAIILLFFGYSYSPIDKFIPVINIRFIAYIFAIAASVIYAKRENIDAYKYIAISIGFALIHFESHDIVNAFNVGEYLISVCWILYAGLITAAGIFLDKKYLKLSGIWLCIISVIRIFIYDLAHVDMIYKLISFITLGIIFMYISYYYNKKEK